jgi:hypothetical protein
VIVIGGDRDSRTPGYAPDYPMPPANGGAYPPSGNGTYPYDGGPATPVPLPRKAGPGAEQAPQPRTVPMDGRSVSLPAATATTRFAYPAYGEEPTRTRFAEDRSNPVIVQRK